VVVVEAGVVQQLQAVVLVEQQIQTQMELLELQTLVVVAVARL
jgi:hypothetical protein